MKILKDSPETPKGSPRSGSGAPRSGEDPFHREDITEHNELYTSKIWKKNCRSATDRYVK